MAYFSILILDDEAEWLERHYQALTQAGFECHTTQRADKAIERLKSDTNIKFVLIDEVLYEPQQILAEAELQNLQGNGVIRSVSNQRPDIHFIIISDAPRQRALESKTFSDNDNNILANFIEATAALSQSPDNILTLIHKLEFEQNSVQTYERIISLFSKKGHPASTNVENTLLEFFKSVEAEASSEDERTWIIQDITGNSLRNCTPFPTALIDTPTIEDVNNLWEKSIQLNTTSSHKCGILVHKHRLDPATQYEIGKVRYCNDFKIIPISLAHIEETVQRGKDCKSLLQDYANRYIFQTDFFNETNAITDSLRFFGRYALLDQIKNTLLINQSVGIFGLRKVGKTSFLNQLEQKLILEKYPVVHLDLQLVTGDKYGVTLFKRILGDLAKLIQHDQPNLELNFSERLNAQDLTTDVADIFVTHMLDLSPLLQKVGYQLPIVCLLDEIEAILPSHGEDLSTAEKKAREFTAFIGVLRALSQTHQLLVLVVADLYPDCNRINEWSEFGIQGVRTNPVFEFFQEFFLAHLSQDDTQKMLVNIGKLMYRSFEPGVLEKIDHKSGRHPFIARQLASCLHSKLDICVGEDITTERSNPLLDEIFEYAEGLPNYFEKSIWHPIVNHQSEIVSQILKLLACNNIEENISQKILLQKLKVSRRNDLEKCLLWLQQTGLIHCTKSNKERYFTVQIPLLAKWIRNEMTKQEEQAWRL